MADDLGFLQEIDDAMRVEKLEQFWQRFGNWVIAACVAVVLGTVASVVWKSHLRDVRGRETATLLRAGVLMESARYDEAASLLEPDANGKDDLGSFALLLRARALREAGKMDAVRDLYASVASARGGDLAIRDIATLELAALGTGKNESAALDRAAETGRPYATLARTLAAVRLADSGDRTGAARLLKGVAEDEAATETERERALEILSTLGDAP